MLPLYHPGFYHKKWTCCEEASPKATGCIATGSLSAAYEGNCNIGCISFGNAMKLLSLSLLNDLPDLSETSGNTLTRNPMLSESFSSGSTLKSQEAHQSFSSDDSTHQ